MPRPRIDMRKIREVLRLALGEELSRRQVSAASGVPLTTVSDYLRRAASAGLKWPLPGGLDDAGLEALLYPPAAPSVVSRPVPDWDRVHKELPTATSLPGVHRTPGYSDWCSDWCSGRCSHVSNAELIGVTDGRHDRIRLRGTEGDEKNMTGEIDQRTTRADALFISDLSAWCRYSEDFLGESSCAGPSSLLGIR